MVQDTILGIRTIIFYFPVHVSLEAGLFLVSLTFKSHLWLRCAAGDNALTMFIYLCCSERNVYPVICDNLKYVSCLFFFSVGVHHAGSSKVSPCPGGVLSL